MSSPFLDPAFEIRWSRLTPEHVTPDIGRALADAQAAIDAIAARPLETVTYENTFGALEAATDALHVAWGKVTHLQSVADSPPLREAHNAMLPQVSAFLAKIPLNLELWRRLKACADTPAGAALAGVRRRHVDETLADFRQAGADLPDEQRPRIEAIKGELAQLTQRYSEHVLDATNAWELVVEDEARLTGIPAHAQAAARRSAEAKGLGAPGRPVWRFTLHQPSQEPVMVYAEDEGMRRELWAAATAVGAQPPYDNTPLVPRILALRDEEAGLLGRPHFAELVLERRMAKTGGKALGFIEDLQSRAAAAFERECRELEKFKAERTGRPAGALAPWEISFWAEKLRRDRHALDEEVLRPYLPMDRVIAGLFELANRVFGLRIVERPSGQVEVWHPEVRFYDLRDASGRHLGSFHADWHPRADAAAGLLEMPDTSVPSMPTGIRGSRSGAGHGWAISSPAAPTDLRAAGFRISVTSAATSPRPPKAGRRCSRTARSRRFFTSSAICFITCWARWRSSRSMASMCPGISSSCHHRSWRTGAGSARAWICLRGTMRRESRFRRRFSSGCWRRGTSDPPVR